MYETRELPRIPRFSAESTLGTNPDPAPLETDDVAGVELSSAAAIDLAVHGHITVDDGFFDVPPGVEETGEFHELAEANHVASDRDVIDRSGMGHPRMVSDVVPTAGDTVLRMTVLLFPM